MKINYFYSLFIYNIFIFNIKCKKPNIVLIVADDYGLDISFYYKYNCFDLFYDRLG